MEKTLAITRRQALGLAAAGLSTCFNTAHAAATSPVLVELFTSQGCSSCPPADRLAGVLAKQPGVVMMSLNVDYWDYLGWRDTLSKPEFTKRQMDYAHERGDNDIYTPQMVINGAVHAVGSNQAVVEAAIANAQTHSSAATLAVKTTTSAITVSLPTGVAGVDSTLWIMSLAPSVNVKIERGENSGKSVTYHNVVRQLLNVGLWRSSESSISIRRTGILLGDCRNCVAVLQQGKAGRALGIGKFSALKA